MDEFLDPDPQPAPVPLPTSVPAPSPDHDPETCRVLFAPGSPKFYVAAICACDMLKHGLEHGEKCDATCKRLQQTIALWHPEDVDCEVFQGCVRIFGEKLLQQIHGQTGGVRLRMIGAVKDLASKLRREHGIPPAIELR